VTVTVHYDDGTVRILHGDCRELLGGLTADVIVTDPPYGLEFMGKEWDRFRPKQGRRDWHPDAESTKPTPSDFKDGVATHHIGMPSKNPRCRRCSRLKFDHAGRRCECPAPEFDTRTREYAQVYQAWTEEWASAAWDALPPGGWLLAFGGTRTWHRLACGLEDAGFELRDTLIWLYGSGFPKSKACLKPGWEPIIVARKPGSSVLQIDASRIGTEDSLARTRNTALGLMNDDGWQPQRQESNGHAAGRWPSNVVLSHGPGCVQVGTRKVRGSNGVRGRDTRNTGMYDHGRGINRPTSGQPIGYADPDGTETVAAWSCEPDCPVFLLDQQSAGIHSAGSVRGPGGWDGRGSSTEGRVYGGGGGIPNSKDYGGARIGDTGGASRFFYTAKAGPAERITVDGEKHATVKPLALMRWLVRLVTPPGGTVLDPFCGSGSTLVAAAMEGFRAIGIEADERWCRGSAQRVREIPPIQEVLAL
jgi:DNA modification methylase